MDEKFIRRFESFRNSLDSLAEAKQRDLSDSFVLSGTSAKFSITFDLAWKVMKDILVQYYAITGFVTGSPREVLRESFQANLITGDEWMDMLKVRNQLAHDYAKTAVGDKYVYEYMMKNGCRIGGEQSGHIIFSKYASTGDGILTSLKIDCICTSMWNVTGRKCCSCFMSH